MLCLVFYLLISNLFLTSQWSLDFTIDTHSSDSLSIFSLSCCFQGLLTCQSQLAGVCVGVWVCVCVCVCARARACSVVYDSLRPCGLQPTTLLCPWDFPAENTGVGCHFLLQGISLIPGMKPASLVSPALAGRFFTTEPPGNPLGPSESESESRSVMSDSLQLHELYSPWTSPSQNTGVGSLSLLQGIFPTQRSNPGLPHCRRLLYQLSHKYKKRMTLLKVDETRE